MLKSLALALLATFAFSGEAEAPKLPKEASDAINKAIEGNLTEASKLYEAYQASLTKAQSKVLASLEGVKKDLNDTKKFVKLSISDRADAIKEIDGKIQEIRKNGLGEKVVAWGLNDGDLFGEGVDLKKMIVGKWGEGKTVVWEFNDDGTGAHYWNKATYSLKWSYIDKKSFAIILDGPTPNRKLTMLDNKTIDITPGKYSKLN